MPFRMSTDNRLGVPDFQLYAVDTRAAVTGGTVVRAYDDAGALGDGEFMYMQASVAVTAGQTVVFRNGPGAALALSTTATHNNSGRSVGVALTNIPAGSWGWFCITGVVPALVSAAAVDGRVFITGTAGTLANTQAAGAQILGAVFCSAAGVPAAGTAYVQLNRPNVQTQIV